MVRSRKLIYPADRMLLEKMLVSKGDTSFFALNVVDIPLEGRLELTIIANTTFVAFRLRVEEMEI